MIEWLQFFYAICTSETAPANWREITVFANAAIAIAYFWIPAVMAVVFARWRQELPFKWLWAGFVVFIVACGLSHCVHAVHAITARTPHNWFALSIMLVTAFVSLATAGLFTYLLPTILRLASPAATKKRLEDGIAKATADLQDALRQERVLLREVHHRVKNNLQVTASLVNLHMRRAPTGPTPELKALRDRIAAMAAVHTQLQHVGASTLRARPFIETLAESLRSSLGQENIAVVIAGADFDVPLDHATAFALIIHEALSNALQHGFRDGRLGTINVALDSTDDRHGVTISDDGAGFDPQTRRGIGDTLIKTLAVQLAAEIDWRSSLGGGTVFSLRFAAQAVPDRLSSS